MKNLLYIYFSLNILLIIIFIVISAKQFHKKQFNLNVYIWPVLLLLIVGIPIVICFISVVWFFEIFLLNKWRKWLKQRNFYEENGSG
jgi:hypothetical protein